jgi:cytochrome c oxidase subunit 3
VSDTALREPWVSLHRQRECAAFGMWVFIASEMLFFGGLIMAYAAYRTWWPHAFALGAGRTDIVFGTVNTCLLVTSSLTMTVASEAARAEMRRLALRCLAATALLGLAFLVSKGLEYRKDLHDNLWPGAHFALADQAARIFFAFYWAMTGVHAIHLGIGVGATALLGLQGWRGERPLHSPAFEVLSLYWHFVDVVWVILFALLYLPGRA